MGGGRLRGGGGTRKTDSKVVWLESTRNREWGLSGVKCGEQLWIIIVLVRATAGSSRMQNYPEQQVFIPVTLLPQICLLQSTPFLFWLAPQTHPTLRTLLPPASDIHSQEDHETPSKPTPDTRTQRNPQTRPTRKPKPRSLKSSS